MTEWIGGSMTKGLSNTPLNIHTNTWPGMTGCTVPHLQMDMEIKVPTKAKGVLLASTKK
jgi:hypothetical protein